MYGREYGGRELRFEASGGLLHYALVMQDKETDSYWSIMTADALAGEFKGTALDEIPVGVKTQWGDWVAEHPDTLVLSVEGVEHEDHNPYDDYFASPDGFRGSQARDERLPTKAPIFSFQLAGKPYAVPNDAVEGGAAFTTPAGEVFLYRPVGVAIFYSTLAFRSPEGGFENRDGTWHHPATGAVFDPEEGIFAAPDGGGPERLDGFDTFWFHWSMTHPETALLGP